MSMSGGGGKIEIKKKAVFNAATYIIISGGECKIEDPFANLGAALDEDCVPLP